MASLERLSRRYGGKHFMIIGVSTDDYPEPARAYLQKSRTTFSHFIDSRLTMENMLGANRIPLTVLVDGHGRVTAKFYGAKDWDSPEAVQAISRSFRIPLSPAKT
jgi:hypothetical protein